MKILFHVVAFILGVFIGQWWLVKEDRTFILEKLQVQQMKDFEQKYNECIKELPRHQDCVFELTPKIVDKE